MLQLSLLPLEQNHWQYCSNLSEASPLRDWRKEIRFRFYFGTRTFPYSFTNLHARTPKRKYFLFVFVFFLPNSARTANVALHVVPPERKVSRPSKSVSLAERATKELVVVTERKKREGKRGRRLISWFRFMLSATLWKRQNR